MVCVCGGMVTLEWGLYTEWHFFDENWLPYSSEINSKWLKQLLPPFLGLVLVWFELIKSLIMLPQSPWCHTYLYFFFKLEDISFDSSITFCYYNLSTATFIVVLRQSLVLLSHSRNTANVKSLLMTYWYTRGSQHCSAPKKEASCSWW